MSRYFFGSRGKGGRGGVATVGNYNFFTLQIATVVKKRILFRDMSLQFSLAAVLFLRKSSAACHWPWSRDRRSYLQKHSCEEIVMKNTMYPVAPVLCLNKFRRLPTGKRYQLQTVTVGEMANDLASSVES